MKMLKEEDIMLHNNLNKIIVNIFKFLNNNILLAAIIVHQLNNKLMNIVITII